MDPKQKIQDHWFHEAKKSGWRSRAAYKLKQIDEKKKILQKKMFVLDLGAAPGSWMQVASEKVGPEGKVVGIDINPINKGLPKNTTAITGDFLDYSLKEITDQARISYKKFDIVLSDMAPSTTGHSSTDHFRSANLVENVLVKIPSLLKKNGCSVIKIFEGERTGELFQNANKLFKKVKIMKPPSSKQDSREAFFVCENLISTYSEITLQNGPKKELKIPPNWH